MKGFMKGLTDATGSTSGSGLHVHPLMKESSELGDVISAISRDKQKEGCAFTHQNSDASWSASARWHGDV